MQSFIPLTCGCGGRANVVDEVGRVAVTASEVVSRPVPLPKPQIKQTKYLSKSLKSQQCRYSTMQSFIPLTCGCGGRANVVDEVGRVAVTASEVVPRPVPLVALSCCCCRFLAFRCFLRDVFLLSLQRTRTNSAKFS